MTAYTCPTCMQPMDRDLLLFIKHTDVHIEHARRAVLFKKTQRPNRLKTALRSVVLPFALAATRLAFNLQGRYT